MEASPGNTITEKLNVYIWDMDETLILLKTLLDGTYAKSFNGLKDIKQGVEIGKMWEKLILQVCDEYFFYEQIENFNSPLIDALSEYDDGRDLLDYDFNHDGFGPPCDDPNRKRLAYRYRVISHKYKQGLCSILDQEIIKEWNYLYDLTDNYTDGWLSSARALMEECSGDNEASSENGVVDPTYSKVKHINVLVTSGSLIPSLVKCMLFRLDDLIAYKNVYSSWEVSKLKCFEWIKERWGNPNVRFCVIGDGWEECEAAQRMRWPFIQIDTRPDGVHRFPGLTLTTVGHYLSVIYGSSPAENDKD